MDPKKGIAGSFFRLSAQRRPAEPTDSTQPSPKHPKGIHESHFWSTLAPKRRSKCAQGGARVTCGTHFWPRLPEDERRRSFLKQFGYVFHFSKYFYGTFCFYPSVHPWPTIPSKKKQGLKGSDFFSFQFFFLSLPSCFFPTLPFYQPYLTGGTSA